MKRWLGGLALAVAAALALTNAPAHAQGGLSNQVLQLLTRVNSWTNTNTFADLRMANAAIPSVTTYRIYADQSGNLYFNGGLIAGAGGGVTPHNLLSTTHPDTLTGSPVRGSVITGNSTPKWAALAIGANHTVLESNGTDTVFGTDGSGLTGLVAANLTGALPAISGASLTSLNASNLSSGTVPLAQLSGITNTQIAAGAGIVYSKLSLTGLVVNTDIAPTAAIAYTKLNLAASVQSSDLVNATLLFAKIAQNGASTNQAIIWNGSAWAPTTITQAIVTNAGTVTSVALSMPAIFSVAGSPITTNGTLAVTAANETANTVWAGPTSGGANAPSFRTLVNADLPTSGVVAGTYPWVTVNAQGVITAASATIATGTVTASTPLTTTQTWNNVGVNFTAWLLNVTNTNSGAASLLADFQLGGVSKFNIDKLGDTTQTGVQNLTAVTNQQVFGTSNTTTASYSAPASSITLQEPNIAGSVPTMFSCGSTGTGSQNCTPAAASGNTHAYQGLSTLSSGAATITFPVTFASATSWSCVANDVTTPANTITMVPSAGTTAVLTGTGSDVIRWLCFGI